MKHKKLIELLKSGNFSVHYDDNESGRIVSGIHEYGDGKTVFEFDGQGVGYAPSEVSLLVEALGGRVDSV